MMRLRSLSGPELTRFLKFSVVGTVGAVVDFGTFNLLHTRLAVPAVPASVLSFTAAVVSNFIWNRYWTYPDSRSKPIRRQAAQFTMVSLIGLAIRTPLFAFLLGPCTRLAAGLLVSRYSAGRSTAYASTRNSSAARVSSSRPARGRAFSTAAVSAQSGPRVVRASSSAHRPRHPAG